MRQQPREEENEERESGEARKNLQQEAHASGLTGRLTLVSSLVSLFWFLKIFFISFSFFLNSKNKVVYYGVGL